MQPSSTNPMMRENQRDFVSDHLLFRITDAFRMISKDQDVCHRRGRTTHSCPANTVYDFGNVVFLKTVSEECMWRLYVT